MLTFAGGVQAEMLFLYWKITGAKVCNTGICIRMLQPCRDFQKKSNWMF